MSRAGHESEDLIWSRRDRAWAEAPRVAPVARLPVLVGLLRRKISAPACFSVSACPTSRGLARGSLIPADDPADRRFKRGFGAMASEVRA